MALKIGDIVTMEDSNGCYSCKYQGSIPGDNHICCRHPNIKHLTDNPIEGLITAIASMHDILPIVRKFRIKAGSHGIKKGWFFWPWNFDPVWLENCDAYEPK